jgi:putative exosortase-associated protein (TIGR04073 family)
MARGLANVLYGLNEIPATVGRYGERHTEQSIGVWTAGFFHGVQRTGARWKYGFYELVNWQKPLYKDSYRPPYPSINYLPWHGYEEFPPQLGFLTTTGYTRGLTW